MYIGVVLTVVVCQRIDNNARLLSGRRVIEVGQMFSPHTGGEYWELGAQAFELLLGH